MLNGSFDEIFQFKGFDLKTGKMSHDEWRKESVTLIGEGYEYLWTRNALERNGYKISDGAKHSIRIVRNNNAIEWIVGEQRFNSLKEVFQFL